MIIDCDTCVHSPAHRPAHPSADTGGQPPGPAESACSDCVVSVLLGFRDESAPPTQVDDDHAAAITVLAESGLVPPLRLVRSPRAS